MPQRDAVAFDGDEALVFGGLQRVDREPERREREQELAQPRDAVGRDHTDRAARRIRQTIEPDAERFGDARTDRRRFDTLGRGHPADDLGQFEQRERVARRDLHELVGRGAAEPGACREQLARVHFGEAVQHEGRNVAVAERDPLLASDRRDHDDRLHRQAADREGERLEGGLVDPLRVVDGDEHRRRLGQRDQKGVQRDAHGERVRGLAVQRQRALEGLGLGRGQGRDLFVTGPSSSVRPAKASSASLSTPCARSWVSPRACSRAYSTSADLPMPASPRSTSNPLAPERAVDSRASMRCRSARRPTSTQRA